MRRGANPGRATSAAIRAAGQTQRPHRRAEQRLLRHGRPGNAARRGIVAGGKPALPRPAPRLERWPFPAPHQVAMQRLALLAQAALLVSSNE